MQKKGAYVVIRTYSYRIKDEKQRKILCKMSRAVNLVWNYCNETTNLAWRRDKKWLSRFDLNNLTSGSYLDLGIHSQTIQAVCEEHANKRDQFKKCKLRWRSTKKSLGWIPFKSGNVKLIGDIVRYQGYFFRLWLSRPIPGKIKTGSFNQDSRGRWYVHFQVEMSEIKPHGDREIGIDLGIKTQATCSDRILYERENLTTKHEEKLAKSQRAKKKKQTKICHAKIKNQREDWNHKTTTKICETSLRVAVGKPSIQGLVKTKMAKSIYDASWGTFILMLLYKAITHNIEVKVVNEAYSTQTCHLCKERTGPKGLQDLSIREWTCVNCKKEHDRDVNAAMNIFHTAYDRFPYE